MKIVVIDGQGGRMGKNIIEQLKQRGVKGEIYAIGTNSTATSVMMKAGADHGATGENPVICACRDADVIVGPIGIVIADSLLGEVTPNMAVAVGQSRAKKVLLPVNKCNSFVVCSINNNVTDVINEAVELIEKIAG